MQYSIIIIGSAALGWPWPQANIASDLYPGHPPANFYNPISLHLPQYSVRRSLMWGMLQGTHVAKRWDSLLSV